MSFGVYRQRWRRIRRRQFLPSASSAGVGIFRPLPVRTWGKPLLGEARAAALRNHPRYRGCVGHWLMAEGAGALVHDIAGTNPGTPSGGYSWETGQYGPIVLFDGTDSVINAGASTDLDMGTGPFTVSAWIKTTTTGTNDSIAGKGAFGAGGKRYLLALGFAGAGQVSIGIDDNTTAVRLDSTSTYNDGMWHHVVGMNDTTNLSLYVDGQSAATPISSAAVGDIDSTRDFRIGAHFNEGTVSEASYFDGRIDDVRVYNRALTLAEVQSLYYRPFLEFEEAIRIQARRFIGTQTIAVVGRTTKNTDAYFLGVNTGISHRMHRL